MERDGGIFYTHNIGIQKYNLFSITSIPKLENSVQLNDHSAMDMEQKEAISQNM